MLALLAQNQSKGCTFKPNGVYRKYAAATLEGIPYQVLPDCSLQQAQRLCTSNSTCFGIELRSASTILDSSGSSGTTICTLHSTGVPVSGGPKYANSTIYAKEASTADGAAEACLLSADAHAMIVGKKPMASFFGPHSSNMVCHLPLLLVCVFLHGCVCV